MRSRYDADIKQINEELRVHNYDRADITIKDHNPPPGDSTYVDDLSQHEQKTMPTCIHDDDCVSDHFIHSPREISEKLYIYFITVKLHTVCFSQNPQLLSKNRLSNSQDSDNNSSIVLCVICLKDDLQSMLNICNDFADANRLYV